MRWNYIHNGSARERALGKHAVRQTIVTIASLLFLLAGLVIPSHAAQEDCCQQVRQSVTKKTRAVAAHAGVQYMGLPQFAAIQETSISYATNTPEEVLNFGNNFYLIMQQVWLISPNAQGPWRVAPYIPKVIAAIVCSQLNSYPLNPYQLCALPWKSGLSYTVWKPSQKPRFQGGASLVSPNQQALSSAVVH